MALPHEFEVHPGLLYVVATLLPLASFVLILLAFGLRAMVRPYRESELCGNLYRLMGGEQQGRGAAYVATGAIGLAFVLCLAGFVMHARENPGNESRVHQLEESLSALEKEELEAKDLETREKLKGRIKTAKEEIQGIEARWSDRIDWARVGKKALDDEGVDQSNQASVLQLGYRIDTLAAVMFLMVTLIATLIHVFSIGYMSEELQPVVEDHQVHTETGHLHRPGRFGRFFLFLSLFCFSMLNLVLADNLFQVFVSWELVGLCSYLLIGFYFERHSASTAANKAFIVNRVGDAGFIIGLLILWTYVGTFNFDEIFHRIRAPLKDANGTMAVGGQVVRANELPEVSTTEYKVLVLPEPGEPPGSQVVLFPRELSGEFRGVGHDSDEKGTHRDTQVKAVDLPKSDEFGSMPYWLLVVAGLGVFLGCVGKSAQFPLHVWLPDAMEGPTPVSALIHAATMVAAGVYLVGRAYPLFTPESRLVIAYTGGITLFVAATIAIVMTDIKKVLAYSTVSQLGYMMLALGVGGWVAGLFHLITHAFFKALLFLGSGSVIYGCHHEQEMTKMGGLYPKMKITALTMLVGVLTIAGTPFFSGWYSKDAILAQAFGFVKMHPEHLLLFVLPLITAGITTFYMFRMWFMTFTGKPRDEHVHEHAHESPWLMTVPLIVLAFFSVIVAWGWPLWDAEASFLEGHLHHSQPTALLADFSGPVAELGEHWEGPAMDVTMSERYHAHHGHELAGTLALAIVVIGVIFAMVLYYYGTLDPAEAVEQFPAVHRFLSHKWYFDELYSALLVRPALVVAKGCRWFDSRVLDGQTGTEKQPVYVGVVNWVGTFWVWVSWLGGRIDSLVVDGLVNLTARVIYSVGGWLRTFQTGYIRSYVLFLVLAAVGIFVILSYLVRIALAG
jgi:NADH-quinone oxidoreductase subunit L